MDDKSMPTEQHKHGKLANWKRKGKLSELDRLKKRQKELHIMKLSQEWDARRQKRKMDRIQWLQQRKDQGISQNESTETTQSSEEASGEELRAEQVVLGKANNPPVSTISNQQIANERPRAKTNESVSTEDNSQMNEITSEKRHICEEMRPDSTGNDAYTNQVYSKSVVVKTEHQESDRFSNSNSANESQQSNSRNLTRLHVEGKKRRRKENQDIRRARTVENPLGLQSSNNESKDTNSYESLVGMVNSQSVEPADSVQSSSVIVQAMKQSGLDHDEEEVQSEEDDEPSLLMASEPVRFEEVLQGGGTCIQRLPTQTVSIVSNHESRKQHDEVVDKIRAHRSLSRDSVEEKNNRIRKGDDSLKNEQPYPKIKQCYSLMAQDSKISRPTPLSSPSSACTGSPVTCTTAHSSPEANTVSNDVRRHPVAQATSTGSDSCPPSGYLVPVYKPSQDEVVYAFVPNAGERGHSGHPRPPEPGMLPANSPVYSRTEEQFVGYSGYPTGRPPTAIIHHGRNLNSSLERAPYPQKVETHQPTNVTWVNVQPASTRDKREYPPKVVYTPNPAVREVPVSCTVPTGNPHQVKQRETEVIVKSRQNPNPVVTMVNGYSPIQSPVPVTDSSNNGPLLRSSPQNNTTTDSINNPTAVYVRPRLVPREIVVPFHAGSGNVPIVEYIKTDVICNKDLANWTSHNVAEFISATDCSDSASIFVEQDIDGKAVLLLSQDIFVNRLNLKLGTAIKLYNHIANLRSALLM